jgi:hypothetical protein
MKEGDDILNKLYEVIKSNFDFDGYKFYFNDNATLMGQLEPLYNGLNIDKNKMDFTSFQASIIMIGSTLATLSNYSTEGKDMIEKTNSAFIFFNTGKIQIPESLSSQNNQLEIELRQKITSLYKKHSDALKNDTIDNIDIKEDIEILNKTYAIFKQKMGDNSYNKTVNTLTTMMTYIMNALENFEEHKDTLLDSACLVKGLENTINSISQKFQILVRDLLPDNITSNKKTSLQNSLTNILDESKNPSVNKDGPSDDVPRSKKSIGDVIMRILKAFLYAIAFKKNISPTIGKKEYIPPPIDKKELFVNKLMQKRSNNLLEQKTKKI